MVKTVFSLGVATKNISVCVFETMDNFFMIDYLQHQDEPDKCSNRIPIVHVHLSPMSVMSTSEKQDSVFYGFFWLQVCRNRVL